MPEVLADLSGPLGGRIRRELPSTDLVRRIWSSVRDLRDIHGVSEGAMKNAVPEVWRNRSLCANEEGGSGQSDVEALPAHVSRNYLTQHKLGQQVNRVQYQRYVTSLDQLPEAAGPSGPNDVFGGIETRDLAEVRRRSFSKPGTVACLRVRPVNTARITPASARNLHSRVFGCTANWSALVDGLRRTLQAASNLLIATLSTYNRIRSKYISLKWCCIAVYYRSSCLWDGASWERRSP